MRIISARLRMAASQFELRTRDAVGWNIIWHPIKDEVGINMKQVWKWTVLAVLVLGSVGCRSERGLLQPPGTIEKQRFNATVFDPYADNDIAPEVVGGRPKDFQKPLSDSSRSQLFRKIWLPF